MTWFTRIGAAVLILGAALALKYLADSAWLGPRGRVAAGAVAGFAVLAAAERLRARADRGYVHALLGVEPTNDTGTHLQQVLGYLTQSAPSFSLRGGTREILRGIIARGLGLR